MKEVASEIDGDARAIRLDVSDSAAVRDHVEEVAEEGGSIDGIFNGNGSGLLRSGLNTGLPVSNTHFSPGTASCSSIA